MCSYARICKTAHMHIYVREQKTACLHAYIHTGQHKNRPERNAKNLKSSSNQSTNGYNGQKKINFN